ncbi:MAG: hypothetical protein EOP51_05140 [Sphingobacteriales bacterium]|nr:MAG: hypothetical protein EOP51_05140 [Sphingobacteriales bacterium]
MQETVIAHKVHIANGKIARDNKPVISENITSAEDAYRLLGYNYPKFFKMDVLSKWAWLASECILNNSGARLDEGMDKTKIGLVLMTGDGCMDVDKRYQKSISDIPSPALFVYTLPNIMLGEICIRNGYKGEQLCLINANYNEQELNFWASDLLYNRDMAACLTGWVNIKDGKEEVILYWLTSRK